MNTKHWITASVGLGLGVSATATLLAKPTTQPVSEASCAQPGGGGCADGVEGEETGVAMLFDRATAVTDIENGLRFQFAIQPGLLAELVKVMDGSEEGCKGLKSTLAVNPQAGEVTLELSGPVGTAELLRKM